MLQYVWGSNQLFDSDAERRSTPICEDYRIAAVYHGKVIVSRAGLFVVHKFLYSNEMSRAGPFVVHRFRCGNEI